MRLVVVGQAAFGGETLDRLSREHDVVAAYCPADPPSGRIDPMKAKALEKGIPVFQPKSMKTDEVHRQFAAHEADLGLLAYVTVIVPERIIQLPRLGTLCFHPSLLPRYRGGSALNWQIIRGEKHGGLTVFWTDAGIDTGPILLQKEVDIGPDDTTGSLYYDKIFPLGIDAMEEAVRLVAQGSAPRIVQDDARASYDPLCKDEHVGIDWSRPPRAVYDLIRGADPQPGAWTLRRDEKLRLYDARLESSSGARGEVLEITENGARIGVGDAVLRVARFRTGDSSKKVTAGDLARNGALAVGDRFESSP